MADHVADDDADLAGADLEQIEPVTTDLLIGLSGNVPRRYVQAGEDRKVGQETALQGLGHPALAAVQAEGGVAAAGGLIDHIGHEHRSDQAGGQRRPRRVGGDRTDEGTASGYAQQPVTGPGRERLVAHHASQREV